MLRRVATTSLIAALALSTLAAPAVSQSNDGGIACANGAPPAGFEDVSSHGTHGAAIDCAVELGVVRGTTATTFSPDNAVSREQIASLLARSLDQLGIELPPLQTAPEFDDLSGTHGANVRQLAAADIVQGYGDGTFGPTDDISREQLASVLVRTLEFVRNAEVTSDEPAGFDDVTGGTHAGAIDAAFAEGLLRGRDASTFDPRSATRRDQAASVVVRFLDVADADTLNEVWSMDQGTDLIHVYAGGDHDEIATIDVSPEALADAGFDHAPESGTTVPHMIEFDSQERYAFLASTAGAITIVVDATTKEVVEVLPTGAGTHMAAVTPDDSAVWVAAIAAERMVEIPLDLDADEPNFEIGRSLDVGELLEPHEDAEGWDFPSYQPICHQYSPDSSEAWVTLGPGWDEGGFFVLDLESGEASHAWDPEVIKANCGVSVTEDQVISNWSGQVVDGDNTNGEWYVFDPDTKEHLDTRDAEGFDAHGLRISPDGSEYWQVNRASDNALVIDAETLEVTARYDDIADTPDIIDYSPDGERIYITQRGPSPLSGAIHAAAGDQPGVAVVDTATGETIEVLEPREIREEPSADHPDGRILNDVHGVGVRTRGDGQSSESAPVEQADSEVQFVPAVADSVGLNYHCDLTDALSA